MGKSPASHPSGSGAFALDPIDLSGNVIKLARLQGDYGDVECLEGESWRAGSSAQRGNKTKRIPRLPLPALHKGRMKLTPRRRQTESFGSSAF